MHNPEPPPFSTRPEIRGTFGAASSTHWLASQTAMGVMERGGNAFDAAFAAGMVLQVCEPHMNGAGGDVPIILYGAGMDEPRVICGQGPAPQAATIDRYRALDLEIIPGTGLLAAVVPGAFDAWMLMLRDYGTMSFAELMEPAIGYAARGCPLTFGPIQTIAAVEELLRDHWAPTAEVFLPGGALPTPGQLYRNPTLAGTWQRLVKESEDAGGDRERRIDAARTAWYEGFIAEEIDRYCREEPQFDVTGQKNTGFLTGDDMANWRAGYEAPVHYDYEGHRIFKCGAWSQGPVALQCLALLKDAGLDDMDPAGADFVHTVTEAMKLAFADRDTYYGDPDFIDVPLETMLSEEYNAPRRAMITDQASEQWRPGKIGDFGYELDYDGAAGRSPVDGVMAGFGGGEPTLGPGGGPKLHRDPRTHVGDTCHLDVIDAAGNMVSVTPSGGWLQSSPIIPKLGFCLGTRLQMCWLDQGAPSALAPGKRPRTTLTPSMAFRAGEPYMAYGTPGGDNQDQWQLSFLLRHIHHDMNLQQAIDCPAFHSEHFPSSFYPRHAKPARIVMEARFAKETVSELEERGHDVQIGPDWSEGRLAAVAKEGDIIKAGANPRGMQGYAVGR